MRIRLAWIVLGVVGWLAVTAAVPAAEAPQRVAYLRGEELLLPAPGVKDGETLSLVCTQGEQPPLALELRARAGQATLSTWLLAAGRYDLALRSGDRTLSRRPLVIVERRRGEAPFLSIFEAPPDKLGELAGLGVDNVYHHIAPYTPAQSWDEYFQHGLTMTPILNAQIWAIRGSLDLSRHLPREEFRNEWGQILSPSGALGSYFGSANGDPLQPGLRDYVRQYVQRIAGYALEQPGLQGIAFDDEYGLSFDLKQGLANYSPLARRRFRELTGLPVPEAQLWPPGVIPDEAPIARWLETLGSPGQLYGNAPSIQEYNRLCTGAAKSVNPALRAYTYPGAAVQGMDMAVTELVPYSYRYSDLAAWMELDGLRADSYRDDLPLEVMPGYYAPDTDKAANPPWVEQELLALGRLSLARGADSIDLFIFGALQHLGIRASFAELGDTQKRYGRFLRQLTPAPMPVGILHSTFNTAMEYYLDYPKLMRLPEETKYVPEMERPWRHGQALEVGFPAAIKAGLAAEAVSDGMLATEDLSRFRALVLLNIEYMRASTVRRLEDYVREGGKVFVDSSSEVRPRGAIRLDGDFLAWHRLITQGQRFGSSEVLPREQVEKGFANSRGVTDALTEVFVKQVRLLTGEPPVDTNSREIVATVSESGRGRYVFLVNTDLTQERSAPVRINLPCEAAYDVWAGDRMDLRKGKPFTVTLPPAGWQLIALLPERIGRVELGLVVEPLGQTCRVALAAQVTNREGVTLPAAFPVRVEFVAPDGSVSPHSYFDAAHLGALRGETILAANDPRGGYTVRVTELSSGLTATGKFTVK